MDKFEKLNRETFNHNNGISRNLDPSAGVTRYGTHEYWLNYWNNQTHKQNNGEYSKHY